MRIPIRSLAILGLVATSMAGFAQNQPPIYVPGPIIPGRPPLWSWACLDPNINTWYSPGTYGINWIGNDLFSCTMGLSGTVQYGGGKDPGSGTMPPYSPCYNPAITMNVHGKFCFQYGPIASIQRTSANFSDSNLAINLGAPQDPAWCFVNLSIDGTRSYWGGNISEAFEGDSNRYMTAIETDGPYTTQLTVELVADAARFRWNFTNNTTADHTVGLWFGSNISMLTDFISGTQTYETQNVRLLGGDLGPANGSSEPSMDRDTNFIGLAAPFNPPRVFKPGFIEIPTGTPPTQGTRFDKTLDPAIFPDYFDFLFGQTDAWGIRIESGPSDATTDNDPTNQPTHATQYSIVDAFLGLGGQGGDNVMPDQIIPDTTVIGDLAFIQKFPEQTVAAGKSLQILHYVRTPWGVANYALPYGMVVDAPKLVNARTTDLDGNPTQNGLYPDPMTIRVWVDNVGGFGGAGREFPLNDVRVHLAFQDPGIAIVGQSTKTIANVPARQDAFVDFTAKVAPDFVGDENYIVTIDSQPGTVHKQVTSTIRVSMRPAKRLYPTSNLISAPYVFKSSAWADVLQNFITDTTNVRMYAWDPAQQGYVISLGAERGRGVWAVYNGKSTYQQFGGTPTTPAGFNGAAPLLQLKSGWNLIADPYTYNFPINQLLGVSSADPQKVHNFAELVSLGFVNNYLATWDPVAKQYTFVDGSSGELVPGQGYWINVLTEDDLTLQFRGMTTEYMPNVINKVGAPKVLWSVRLGTDSGTSSDNAARLGMTDMTAGVKSLRIPKPPMSPTQDTAVWITEPTTGKPIQLAQDMHLNSAHTSWGVEALASKPGQMKLTWDMSAVPANVELTLKDTVTGSKIDLRMTSSYTYTAASAGMRRFVLMADSFSGTAITDLTAAQGSKSVAVVYNLSASSLVCVTILNKSGTSIATAANWVAQKAGKNAVAWNMLSGKGTKEPVGTYYARVQARAPDGSRTEAKVAFELK